MFSNRFAKSISALSIILVLVFAPFSQIIAAQIAQTRQVSSDNYAEQFSAIEAKIEKRRAELGIPGLSLAIVKDGKIIYSKGFGYKDFEKKIAVTPDTQFEIGSATKAFTALSVMMSQDAGKLSIDDSPKKYLPYFKINDAEIDSKIQIRDLLSHASGVNRTDLAMVTGKLNREELIKVVGEAKPIAKLRERFLYQNIMFAAAGEIVAKANGTTWENYVTNQIFKPLGMTNSNVSVAEMGRAKDFAKGYEYNFDMKETKFLPLRDISATAPAGAINSSANDMAKWLEFMMNGGELNGKRLVSEKNFAELTKTQMKIGGNVNYGFGWFLRDWNGLKVVEHGGNIDGFNSQVAFMPDKKIGFVMLTNVTSSPLPSETMNTIWENLVGNANQNTAKIDDTKTVSPEKEIGKYRFEAAGFDVEIKMQDGKLVAIVPSQPTYILENVGGRKYKMTNAPNGFFVTFKDSELFLEQPQGSYALPKIAADNSASLLAKTDLTASSKELVGQYEFEKQKGSTIDVIEKEGKAFLNLPPQPLYELREKSKDTFSMSPLADNYFLTTKRDANNKLVSITIHQPEGEFTFNRLDKPVEKPKITVDELMTKTINALGGEANWRKFKTRVTNADINLENQGVRGTITSYEKAPNKSAMETTLTALNKQIGNGFDYFDGANGAESYSFAESEKYTGKGLENAKINADFYGLVDWKTLFKSAEVIKVQKVGDEDCYVIEFTPEKASKQKIYISQKTFLPVKKDSVSVSGTSQQEIPITEDYSDYRNVDSVMIPFQVKQFEPSNGYIIVTLKSVKHDVEIPDSMFQARKRTISKR